MKTTVEVTCDHCGKPCQKLPSELKRGTKVYCNAHCYRASMKGHGNPNYDHKWSDTQKLSMSQKKMGRPAWNKGLTTETSASVQQYVSKLYGNRHGAATKGRISPTLRKRNLENNPMKSADVRAKVSAKVKGRYGERNPNWRGGTSFFRGAEWHMIRQTALERDKFCCRICGKSTQQNGRSLHVHHIRDYTVPTDNHLDNLISLCIGCHTKVSASTETCPTNQ